MSHDTGQRPAAGLLPLPRHIALDDARTVRLGAAGTLTVAGSHPRDGTWLATMLEKLFGLRVRPGATPADADITIAVGAERARRLAHLPHPAGVSPQAEPADERSRLVLEAAGAHVEATSRAGACRALTSLLQLARREEGGLVLPTGVIEDAPGYAWRGLLLDVARHAFHREEIERVIDLLAWHKLNVLHLHLSDTQAWRLQSRTRPRLTGPGGTEPFFTPGDLRALTEYAAERHVTVVPELDMPGHVTSAFTAYPQLQGHVPLVHPDVRFLHPDVPEAMAFARDVLGELLDLVPGPYLHIGGDEPFGMAEDDFVRAVRELYRFVRSRGKRVVAWQEVARAGCLGGDDLLQYWIGPDNRYDAERIKGEAPPELRPVIDDAARMFAKAPADLRIAAEAGIPVLISSNTCLYLDRPYAGPAADDETEARRRRLGFRAYQPRTTREQFGWHPDALPELTAVGVDPAGVEAAVWCETVESFDDLTFLLLPRLAGVAEKAWSPPTTWHDHDTRARSQAGAWRALGFTTPYRPGSQTTREATIRGSG